MFVDVPIDIAAQKAVLRARFRAYRMGLDEADYTHRSRVITDRVLALPEIKLARTVHVYWPLTSRREVDTRPLIGALQAQGKMIVLPVIDSLASDAPRMRHVRLDDSIVLQPNRWGVGEPLGGASVPVEVIDVVAVPALGAGRNGHRIGYGAGYYDAFLRDLAAPTLGLVYSACLIEAIPAEPHDVPLAVLITEEDVIRPVPA